IIGAAIAPLSVTAHAAAAPTVDPSTLIPPPPPGAVCRADGPSVVCHTGLVFDSVNVPIDFGLPCGVVYETSTDVRPGIRWYEPSSGTIAMRFVRQDLGGTWSLSPTGAQPRVTISAHANWSNDVFPDPADEETWPTTFHGDGLTVRAAGTGVVAHIAGL